jgi:hypothetical protein
MPRQQVEISSSSEGDSLADLDIRGRAKIAAMADKSTMPAHRGIPHYLHAYLRCSGVNPKTQLVCHTNICAMQKGPDKFFNSCAEDGHISLQDILQRTKRPRGMHTAVGSLGDLVHQQLVQSLGVAGAPTS